MSRRRRGRASACLVFLLLVPAFVRAQTDPLPSWNDGAARQSIVAFVQNAADRASLGFVPPEQVIGTSFVTTYKLGADGKPSLLRQPKIDFVDDGPGKPVNIQKFIGRRPVLAFGNSDGVHQMLQWTAAGDDARFVGLVHHTDAAREWAYDRQSHVGRLDKALDEAKRRGWTVVDMKSDWKKIFPFE